MNQNLKNELELCVLNHGHILLSYTYVKQILKYIKELENVHSKNQNEIQCNQSES